MTFPCHAFAVIDGRRFKVILLRETATSFYVQWNDVPFGDVQRQRRIQRGDQLPWPKTRIVLGDPNAAADALDRSKA
jgi:hypothetical protein